MTCAAVLAGAGSALALVAAPASGVTNLYAPMQTSTTAGQLAQFAVAPDGTLAPLAPAALSALPSDIAVTPDGRFAYVSGQTGIARFTRDPATGRMVPVVVVGDAGDALAGILVNPQGTRVFYSTQSTVESRPIDPATGALGAAVAISTGANATPRFLAMTPSGTSLYVGTSRDGTARILQYDVDLATGTPTPKTPAFVDWPAPAGTSTVFRIERMTVTPEGAHLYAASGQSDAGLAHFSIDASGALVGGSVGGLPGDGAATSVAPVSPSGVFLWAPTSAARQAGRIDRFSVGAAGALTPLAPPAPYVVDAPTRDAVAAPTGTTLYLGQDGNIGDWVIGAAATLAPRGNLAATGTNAGLALSPSQAPVASFTAAPQPAGQATSFNAGASVDPDGTIARYDWDFGDGTALPNGGPSPSHVYATPGARNVTLTVTDADGTSTQKLWTGSRMLRNGGPSAQATVTVTIPAPPPPPPPPPPPGPQPDKGVSVTIVTVSGTVRVRLRGSSRYVDVRTLREIPLGSTIDARKGRVRITVEVDARTHKTQTATYYDGIFKIAQTRGSKPFLVATLVGGSFKRCIIASTRISGSAAAVRSARAGQAFEFAARRAKRSKRRVRRLWGRGQGDFRTTGRRSSATVRGTWWLVEDRCDGTLTRVRTGRVDVRDFRLKKTIKLRAGKRSQYLAKAP